MRGIFKPRMTREQAELSFQTALESHPTMRMVGAARIAAALEGKIKPDEPDYDWGKQLRKASRARDRFLSSDERNRELSCRLQLLASCERPAGYGGIADFI